MSFEKIPKWADTALTKPSNFDKAQYEVLQAFYEAWEHLHSLPNDKAHRKEAESAAQQIVEHAHILRAMRDNKPRVLVPGFTMN